MVRIFPASTRGQGFMVERIYPGERRYTPQVVLDITESSQGHRGSLAQRCGRTHRRHKGGHFNILFKCFNFHTSKKLTLLD
jgi:hypothetical protein